VRRGGRSGWLRQPAAAPGGAPTTGWAQPSRAVSRGGRGLRTNVVQGVRPVSTACALVTDLSHRRCRCEIGLPTRAGSSACRRERARYEAATGHPVHAASDGWAVAVRFGRPHMPGEDEPAREVSRMASGGTPRCRSMWAHAHDQPKPAPGKRRGLRQVRPAHVAALDGIGGLPGRSGASPGARLRGLLPHLRRARLPPGPHAPSRLEHPRRRVPDSKVAAFGERGRRTSPQGEGALIPTPPVCDAAK
jgi:hypothetical protein